MAQAAISPDKKTILTNAVLETIVLALKGGKSLEGVLIMLDGYDTTAIHSSLSRFCEEVKDNDGNPEQTLIRLLEGFLKTGLFDENKALGQIEKDSAEALKLEADNLKKQGDEDGAYKLLSRAFELLRSETERLRNILERYPKT